MSRRHKSRNKPRKVKAENWGGGGGSRSRRISSFQLQRLRSTAPKPTPAPQSSQDQVVTVDIRYAARYYRVYLPPPGEGMPKDARLELMSWDDGERMCWEHVCPRILYCGGCGNGCGGVRGESTSGAATASAAMDGFQWEPELAEMVKRAAAALKARMGKKGEVSMREMM
jgi:hypothetical protein